ncbi:hypothetical protein [Actinopolymorpha pittospori]|uniref:Major Facilitator Superfamily protein n=1 Tax=Actinopolymorpha pittospori TaxID=648752 RepID=A0A927MNR7_9ACTN|nr:hypothetical protein [Actinopolymorpha pittospori]MBE1604085.1 hypothetical protein [Actinopolymorpha pittospori]
MTLPLVSRDRYGSEVVLAGAMTGYTVGALIGAVTMARWRPRNQGWVALAGLALYGFTPLVLMLAVHPTFIVGAYVVVGMGIELFNVPWFTATQREVAPSKLARVSSLDFLVSYGLPPIGLAVIAHPPSTPSALRLFSLCARWVCLAAPAIACLVPSARHFSTRTGKEPM